MSVSLTHARNNYVGDNSASTFDWTFYVLATSELEVVEATFVLDDDQVTKIWTETTLTLNVGYTAARIASTGKGTITRTAGALGTNFRIAIRRKAPVTQEVDIKNALSFDPRTHETALDRGTYMAQQIQDDADRCVKLHITDSDGSFDPTIPIAPDENATATLAVNAAGNAFEWGPTTSDLDNAAGVAAAAAASAAAAAASAAAASASEVAANASAAAAAASALSVANIEKRLLFTIKGPYTTTQSGEATGQLALCDTSGGGWTFTLPSAIMMNDVRVTIKKNTDDANVLTVEADGAETVDGELNLALTYGFAYVVLVGNGSTKWHVIG